MYKQKPIISISVFVVIIATLFALFPKNVDAAITVSSVTLSNSRLSYKAGVTTGSSGSSLVTIDGSGNPDNNTSHLFPGDTLCFTDAGQNGCIGSTTYTVSTIIDSTNFNLTSPLGADLDTSGYVVASQSGVWTIAFKIGTEIPVDGSILVTIPMADGADGNNGIPDAGASIATSGFDLRGLTTGDITISGCTPANWGTPVIVEGSGTTDHTIEIPRSTATCPADTVVQVTIGLTSPPWMVNPAPIMSGHTQGTADIYGVTVATRDNVPNTLESSIPRAFLVEAILISATIDESLSFVVTGLSAGTYCGNTTVATTATSIPWGHLAAANTFYYAAQQLIVNTNSAGGYVVTIEENDQMGKNGNTCTSTSPSAGNYTFGTGNCIRDTICTTGNCSESAAADWTDATNYPGLGYSLASQSGTDAPFFYNEKTRTWSAKQLADKTEGGETAATIMNNSGPVSGSSIYVCYKITVPGNQPSGYYYNIAKYTVTATF